MLCRLTPRSEASSERHLRSSVTNLIASLQDPAATDQPAAAAEGGGEAGAAGEEGAGLEVGVTPAGSPTAEVTPVSSMALSLSDRLSDVLDGADGREVAHEKGRAQRELRAAEAKVDATQEIGRIAAVKDRAETWLLRVRSKSAGRKLAEKEEKKRQAQDEEQRVAQEEEEEAEGG